MRKLFMLACLLALASTARAADLCVNPFQTGKNNWFCDTNSSVTNTPVVIQSGPHGTQGSARQFFQIENNSDLNASQASCGVCFGAVARGTPCSSATAGTILRPGQVMYRSYSGTNGPQALDSLYFNSDISIIGYLGGTCYFSVSIDG